MNDELLEQDVDQPALFEVEAREEGRASRLRLLVHFSSRKDRADFSLLIGQRIGADVKAISYPVANRLPAEYLKPVETFEAEQPDLLDVKHNWHDAWRGMPAYAHQDLDAMQTIEVYFESQGDRRAFARLIEHPVSDATKYVWFPKAQSDEVIGLRWKSARPQNPQYPVYVPTKGRWESAYTIKCLERLRIPYYAVVRPQELARYEPVVKSGTILVLPQEVIDSGVGVVPARNWIMEHSISLGARRHWQLDDNIKSFFRYHENRQIHVADGTCMRIAEDFADRYENVAVAGFQYFMFVDRKQGTWPPFLFNTRVYSNSLINNQIPFRWRDVYNEDTDICLRALKAGWCTVQFNAFLAWKQPTLMMKGGNTDVLYAGAEALAKEWEAHTKACKSCVVDESPEACESGRAILERDGRWKMAESLRRQHPDVTVVGRRWNRWQHYVDYRPFKRNEPILRAGVVIPEGQDDYGLDLVAATPDQRIAEGERPAPQEQEEREGGPPPSTERPRGPSALAFVQALAAALPAPGGAGKGEAPGPPGTPPWKLEQPESRPSPAGSLAGEADRDQARFHDACSLRDALGKRGHRLLTREGKLFVSEASRLTQEDRDAIKAFRAELIAMATPMDFLPTAESKGVMPDGRPSNEGPRAVSDQVADASRDSISLEASTSVQAQEVSFFEGPRQQQSLAEFLGTQAQVARLDANFVPDEPPSLDGIDVVALNFATTGFAWHKGKRPVGVTAATMDGRLVRFLPFAFEGGGNLDPEVVKRWAQRELRGKRIVGSKVKFDAHHSREWGVDLEEQGCTFSDVQHTAALLDDHRKRFAIDVLAQDYLPGEPAVPRVDESRHAEYHASEVAARERYTATLVGRLREVMWPKVAEEGLQEVHAIEDAFIPCVIEMERRGARIDLQLLEQFRGECAAERERLMREVSEEAGFAFEHTAKGWQRLLEALGLQVPDSFAEDVLNGYDHPLVKKGQRASQHASLDSKVFSAFRQAVDSEGVLRVEVNQLRGDEGGTVSGRLSSGLQQVPNRDNHEAAFGDLWFPRRLFVPFDVPGIDGFIPEYLEADAMQIEYRLGAHYASNPKVLAAYAEDLDRVARGEKPLSFHRMTWEFMKAYKPDMLYVHQKSFNFARQYGARSVKLAIMMGFITAREGEEIRAAKRWQDPRLATIREIEAAYRRFMPEGDDLLDYASHLAKPECDQYCRKNDRLHRQYPHRGYVKTLKGRRRRFPTNYKTYIGLNAVLQGTGADYLKVKGAELHAERKSTGFVMSLTTHDSFGGTALARETKGRVAEILNRQSFPELKVPILWECGTGRNWAECKE